MGLAISALTTIAAEPAVADHGGVHCMWGKAYDATYTYRWGPIQPELKAFHQYAVQTVNYTMDGRVVIREAAAADGAHVVVQAADDGQNGVPGQWVPVSCDQDPSGHWFFERGEIRYNSWYTDRMAGRVQDWRTGASGLFMATLHEVNHSIGGWHLPINTSFPVHSECNSSSAPINPFYPKQSCERYAGTEKPADIGHLWSRYPGKSPTNMVQCTSPYCEMFLKGW